LVEASKGNNKKIKFGGEGFLHVQKERREVEGDRRRTMILG